MSTEKNRSPLDARLQGLFRRETATRFRGAAWDPLEPSRKFVVELLLDGICIDLAIANIFEPSLPDKSDCCNGFIFEIDAGILAEAGVAEARLANLNLPVGRPIFLEKRETPAASAPALPPIRWLGGLRFAGAVEPSHDDVTSLLPLVKAVIEGETVAEARPDRWQNNGLLGQDAKALAAFDLYLPDRFADGCVHRVNFIGQMGAPLPGSPVVFVAFSDGLAALVAKQGAIESERWRGEMFDKLLPMSVPFARYAEWCERHPKRPAPLDRREASIVSVVLVGDGDEEVSLAALEMQTRPNWVALALPYCDSAQGFDCHALQEFLAKEAATCSFVIFAKTGFVLTPDAIERFDEAFAMHPDAMIAYSDIAIRDADEWLWPIAFPAFDYERMLEQGYCSSLFAVRRAAIAKFIKGKVSNLYRLFNSVVAGPNQKDVLHLPGCLGTINGNLNVPSAGRALLSATTSHLHDRALRAKVALSHAALLPVVKVSREPFKPTVTIVIPVRNRVDLLRKCLESINPAVKKAAAEIIIVDNDSTDPDTLAFLADFETPKHRVLRAPGAFNFSKLNNLAAEAATTDYLCLLNNDVQALDTSWLNELLGRCVEPDVAAVGALLIWPSGVVQHGGVVLGSSLGATHAFNDRLATDSGYADQLLVAHDCSAVTAACMLTRRADYLAVGGLDENYFPINFNDVDYCLKLRARGKRIVFTPHARLLHLESASRGDHQSAHRKALFERELRSLRTRWMDALMADPFYSPLLSLDPVPFSALAWPLRPMGPRWPSAPHETEIPPGM